MSDARTEEEYQRDRSAAKTMLWAAYSSSYSYGGFKAPSTVAEVEAIIDKMVGVFDPLAMAIQELEAKQAVAPK